MYCTLYGFIIGSWMSEIGDPSFMGWFTVLSYYLTAGMCFLRLISRRSERHDRIFWVVIVMGMVVLGLIKQFNLLSALTEAGRMVARSGGWVEERRLIQVCVLMVTFGIFVFIAKRVCFASLSVATRHSVTALGFVYLLFFVACRGISWHYFDVFLSCEIFGVRINWLAELSGIYWVLASSFPRMKRGAVRS